MSADESITSLPEVVAAFGALPMPAGPAPLSAEREREIRSLDLLALMSDRVAPVISGHLAVLLGEIDQLRAQRERRRLRLVALQNDALSMRGSLSPMGDDRKVPFPLGETLTPAVDWLIGRVAELEAERHSTNEVLDDAVQALRASRFFLADVDGADPVLKATEAAAQAHCVAALGSELAGRAFRWAPVGDGVSQVLFTDEPGWGAARVWPLAVSSVDEGGCTCPPPVDRPEPHEFGCPLEDAPCPVDGPLPGVGTGAGAPEMRALRAALYGPPDGEHYAQVHHVYRLGHDLPETGGNA